MAEIETRNLKLVIAYNGSAYSGWQKQAKGIDTVQLRVERSAVHVLHHPLHAHGCSRTDSGVHAEGQVCNIRTPNLAIPLAGMRKAMNSRLPKDIAVRSIVEVPSKFNSSRSASGKTYRYRIYIGSARPVHLSRLVWHYWRQVDIELMRKASARIIGEHDFRAFASSTDIRKTTIRRVYRCDVSEACNGSEIHITIEGDGFLYNMVRNIVGTLMDIGRGRWSPEQIDKIIASRDRDQAGPTAPPDGLTLMCVHYDPHIFQKAQVGK